MSQQRLMTPLTAPSHVQHRHYKNKQEVQLERIPFDESSKFLDSAFDGEKEFTLNRQFIKHARDTYKCYCTVCLQSDSNIMEVVFSPEKTQKSTQFYSSASPVKRNTNRSASRGYAGTGSPFADTFTSNLDEQYKNNSSMMTIEPKASSHQGGFPVHSQYSGAADHDIELYFILKRLVPPSRVTRTLRIFLPETVIFSQGEAKMLIYNNTKDNQLKFVKQREKLQLNELRKFLNERRTKYRQAIEARLEEQRQIGLTQSKFVKRLLDLKSAADQSISSVSTPPNGQTVADSQQAARRMSDLSKFNQYKPNPLKQALENTRKTLKSQEDQQNNGSLASPLPPPLSVNASGINDPTTTATMRQPQLSTTSGSGITNPFGAGTTGGTTGERSEKESKDAVVYKVDSLNDHDTNQTIVINETDFLVLMMKRKIDPIWTNIHYLQNFVRVKRNRFEFQHFHFVYDDVKDDELFVRAYRDIQMLNGEISSVSSEYVSPEAEEEFESNLMQEQVESYQLYMVCKIFHFLQTFHSVTLTCMETEWLIDDIGTLILINCKNISYTNQGRTYITTEMYFKRIEEQAEKKLKLREGLEEKYKDHRKEAIEMFSNAILESYEAKKNKLGIVQTKKVKQEIDISDEVFEKICPEIKFKLSDLLRTNAPIRVLQREILGEKEKTLREKNEMKNSQMFSNVYMSPTKKKTQQNFDSNVQNNNLNASALSSSSMKQTFSILSKLDPPHRRVFSAHQPVRQKSNSMYIEGDDSGVEEFRDIKAQQFKTPQRISSAIKKSSAYKESDIDHLLNSSSIKLVASLDTESSTTKKVLKVKKKTLPYYLFCSPQH